MMQIILVAAFLIAVATMACASPAATLESDSASSSQQPADSGPALLLDEESAISILQTYLQECVISWDEVYANRMARARVQSISMAERRERQRRMNARLSAELEGTVFSNKYTSASEYTRPASPIRTAKEIVVDGPSNRNHWRFRMVSKLSRNRRSAQCVFKKRYCY